jgi:hypothetical protein
MTSVAWTRRVGGMVRPSACDVGSVNTSAVVSTHPLAVMTIHPAQQADFIQIIDLPTLGLGIMW